MDVWIQSKVGVLCYFTLQIDKYIRERISKHIVQITIIVSGASKSNEC